MYTRTKVFGGLMLFIFLLAQSGCGQIGLRPDPQFQLGEAVQIADHIRLTLQFWDVSMDRLKAHLTVENTGTEKFLMRGTFSLLHQKKGSSDLAPQAFLAEPGPAQECASTLYGVVSPGQTMEGDVCWENISGNGLAYPLQMRYSLHTVDLLKKAVSVWTLQTHTVGETIRLRNNVTVTLKGVTPFNGGDGLRLDYLIENQGQNPVYLDSVFEIFHQREFEADLLSDSSMSGCTPAFPGYIQPKQKVSGSACWSTLKSYSMTYPLEIEFGSMRDGGEIIWVVTP